jgi:predicted O-methyltransferase YrrM
MAQFLSELDFKRGAEIGVQYGAHAKILCENNPGLKLYCVDPWVPYEGYRDYSTHAIEKNKRIAPELLAPYDVEFIRKFSMEAVKEFENESLDFVYIDANHDLQNVINDVTEWEKKIKTGGIIFGHDYMRTKSRWHSKQVVGAINAYTYENRVSPWFLLGEMGPWDPDPNKYQDGTRSWMWVVKR